MNRFQTRVRRNERGEIELRYTLACGRDVWYSRYTPVQVVERDHPGGFAKNGCPKPTHTVAELQQSIVQVRQMAEEERQAGNPLADIFSQSATQLEKHLQAHLEAGIV